MEQPITIVVTAEEHQMLLEALDKKIWTLNLVALPGAVRRLPAFVRLRDELADVRPAEEEVAR